jgi:pimeloyl-ACP methyl ester carboxylesterase
VEAEAVVVPAGRSRSHDRAELQRATAKAINAKLSTVKSSHVPQQSQPAKVAAVILDAVQSVK